MIPNRYKLDTTLKILSSGQKSLSGLAKMSGFLLHTFYRGADLRNLDLAGEDLAGMNFDGADFSGTNLDNISFSRGAFNNCKIDFSYSYLVDQFDIYLYDLMHDRVNSLYAFAKFHPREIEKSIESLNMSFNLLANISQVSSTTLRKCRRGQVVSIQSASLVAKALFKEMSQIIEGSMAQNYDRLEQPIVSVMAVNPSGGFNRIYRRDFLAFLSDLERLSVPMSYRYSPTLVTWLLNNRIECEDEMDNLRQYIFGEDHPTLFDDGPV